MYIKSSMMIFAKWEIKMFCVARKCKSHLASAGALYVIIRSLHRATPGSHIELSAGQLKHPIWLGFHLIYRNIESIIILACLRTIAVGNVRSQLWIIRLLCLWGCQGGTVSIALLSLHPSHLAVPESPDLEFGDTLRPNVFFCTLFCGLFV